MLKLIYTKALSPWRHNLTGNVPIFFQIYVADDRFNVLFMISSVNTSFVNTLSAFASWAIQK
jgi:hypothetical protein